MLRKILIRLSASDRMRAFVVGFPPTRALARRFVAGEHLDDAVNAVKQLNDLGIESTIDHLGENTATPDEARTAKDVYLHVLERIETEHLGANISLKPTQMGLALDPQLCFANLTEIAEAAVTRNQFVRIDMEGTAYTEATIDLYRRLRQAGHENVGLVIQAYLRRSQEDVRALADMGADIRLCKGAYAEPPELAFPEKADTDRNFLTLLELMWHSAARQRGAYAAVATHDERLIASAKALSQRLEVPRDHFEFQMLYGIRQDLQRDLVKEGYRMRVYVSYGAAWYPYFMRRLAERPANLLFLARQVVRG